MTRLRRAGAVAAAVSVLAATGTAWSPATADPLGSAKARAAALAAQVQRLQTRAEVATERYDAVQARLDRAVTTQITDDRALSTAQTAAQTAAQTVSDRARALYETGGRTSILASFISGQSPTQAYDRYRMASEVLDYEAAGAAAASDTLAGARALERRDTAAARTVTALQAQQRTAAQAVTALLDRQRRQLAAATGTVRRLEALAAAAAAAAGAQQFSAAVGQAGGSIDTAGPVTAPNQTAATAIAAARSRIGDPYVWGATGPAAFDCSGLTQWSYAHAGIQLPRTAAEQWSSGPHPTLAQLEPGDLLFWATDLHNPATIHHVTIYLGHGMMVAAPHTGTDVQIQPVYMTGFIGATRPWARS